MSYAAQHRPATTRSKPSVLLLLLLGAVTAIAVNFLWLLGVMFVLSLVLLEPFSATMRRVLVGEPDAPFEALVFLVLVAGLGLGAMAAARLIQKRAPGSLFGAGARTLRHFAAGAGATFSVIAVLSLIPPWGFDAYTPNLDLGTWVWFLPFAIIGIIAQTGAEEVFFRGYLQSELASRFRWPIIWLMGPAMIFGLAHFVPGIPTQNAVLYVGFAFLFGVLAGDLTARTGSIGAGWGFHFANNAIALLFLATPGTITGLALYLSDQNLGEPITVTFTMFYDLAAVLLVWVLIRRLLQV